jgi:hypothetical protein
VNRKRRSGETAAARSGGVRQGKVKCAGAKALVEGKGGKIDKVQGA